VPISLPTIYLVVRMIASSVGSRGVECVARRSQLCVRCRYGPMLRGAGLYLAHLYLAAPGAPLVAARVPRRPWTAPTPIPGVGKGLKSLKLRTAPRLPTKRGCVGHRISCSRAARYYQLWPPSLDRARVTAWPRTCDTRLLPSMRAPHERLFVRAPIHHIACARSPQLPGRCGASRALHVHMCKRWQGWRVAPLVGRSFVRSHRAECERPLQTVFLHALTSSCHRPCPARCLRLPLACHVTVVPSPHSLAHSVRSARTYTLDGARTCPCALRPFRGRRRAQTGA